MCVAESVRAYCLLSVDRSRIQRRNVSHSAALKNMQCHHTRTYVGEADATFTGVGAVRDSFGRAVYLEECNALGVVPAAQIVKYLEHEELFLAHYGIASKGLQALLAALKVLHPARVH